MKDKIRKEYLGRGIVTVCGGFIILLTAAIGIFLVIQGTGTFTKFHHTLAEFLFSSRWAPQDNATTGGGSVGAAGHGSGQASSLASSGPE